MQSRYTLQEWQTKPAPRIPEAVKTVPPEKTSTMADDDLNVKGSTILSKLVFARERFGAEAERDLVGFLEEAGEKHILDGSWYPFDLYHGVLERIADRHYRGDLERLRAVGNDSAHRALTGTYHIYGQMGLSHFLDRIGALHNRFYSLGDIEATMHDDGGSCTIRMFGAPYYREADLQVAAGFYLGAARELELQDARCEFLSVGAEVHFRLTWETASE